ncbi:unnamed protein product [Urochloa decumbens]|uniref:DUF4220 domain-containing protein n=1 Tax=Urochloa decumbens TaxID=240449 RepID=A0ABC9FLV0_9POAL
MAGGNSTINCSYAALKQCSSKITCDANMVFSFGKSMGDMIWRVNALLLISAILAGVIVGIGIYGQRYRHHPFTRFIFLGATTLFLPVVSTVVSTGAGRDSDYIVRRRDDMQKGDTIWLTGKCEPVVHSFLVVIWASLVQIIMVNTSAVVAVDDREGGSIGPPFELLVQGVWTCYLGINYIILSHNGRRIQTFGITIAALEVVPFALTCAKMVLKYYAFEKAWQSFALGRNPHLVSRYMKQQSLQETSSHHGEPVVAEDAPPRLLVMGEEKRHVEKQPLGYMLKDDSWTTLHKNGLVTIDRVWRLGDMLPTSELLKPRKDLCLSFALFKLLRCRFAGYKVRNNSGSKGTFSFWSSLLKDGKHDRVFLVILDELYFLHDYYYSSLPISYSKYWLPIVDIFISLLSMAYCCALITIAPLWWGPYMFVPSLPQLVCHVFCIREQLASDTMHEEYGSWYFDLVPVILLSVLVMLAEVRDIASYICSNWTKVALICHLVNNHASLQHSLVKKKWIGLLLRCRCKLMKHWDEKIGQCNMLEIRPRTALPVLLRRLLRLPDQKKKVKVQEAVKACIMEVLRSSRHGRLSNGTACLRRQGQVGERLLWACNNKSTSCTMLTWHIATSILEIRYPHLHDQEQGSSSSPIPNTNYKVAATHLSRYCAYLVTWCPELLPDDKAWSSSQYEDVKKDVERVLAGFNTAGNSLMSEAKCQHLIQVLSANAKHEVLKEGARLGKQLLDLMVEGENAAWKLLAEFWSEMILYVAPSDNLKGHSEAIARGSELITLLWVLLFHAGIISRPGEDDGVPATSTGVV